MQHLKIFTVLLVFAVEQFTTSQNDQSVFLSPAGVDPLAVMSPLWLSWNKERMSGSF